MCAPVLAALGPQSRVPVSVASRSGARDWLCSGCLYALRDCRSPPDNGLGTATAPTPLCSPRPVVALPGVPGVPSLPPLPSPRGRCRLVGGCGFRPPSRVALHPRARGGPAPAASCQNLRQNRLWPLWSEMGGIFTISCLVGLIFACCVRYFRAFETATEKGSLFVTPRPCKSSGKLMCGFAKAVTAKVRIAFLLRSRIHYRYCLPSVVKAKMTTTQSFAIIYRKVVAENDKLQPPETKGSLSSWKPGTA